MQCPANRVLEGLTETRPINLTTPTGSSVGKPNNGIDSALTKKSLGAGVAFLQQCGHRGYQNVEPLFPRKDNVNSV